MIVDAEDQHLHLGHVLTDAGRGVEPGEPWHGNIEDDNVRPQGRGESDGFLAIVHLADDFKSLVAAEHGTDAFADDRMIVSDQHANPADVTRHGRPEVAPSTRRPTW